MKILDILNSPWAIQPDKLREMQEIYSTHLRGEKIDLDAIEARLGRPLANEQQEYSIRQGGIAVLPVEGVISPKANLFTKISGGTSAQMLQQQLESAMADSRVTGIVLAIDSPGGSVNGSPEFAAAVREFAAEKPIVACGEAVMASAAYWIASAANQVFVTGPTVQVGSIGVVASHDYTPNTRGKTTEITAGKYKRIATSNAPLSEEGQAYLQAQVDHLYSVFVEAVADNRGTTTDSVLEHMADGRVFIGQQAIDAGLVDGVSTVDQLVAQMAANPQQFEKRRPARIKAASKTSASAGAAAEDPSIAANDADPSPITGDPSMSDPKTPITRATLEADHAPLVAELRTAFMAEGATAERDRVKSVREQLVPGHEALIEKLATDGKSTGADAAMAIVAATKTQLAAAAAAHAADAPAAARAAAAADDKTKTKAEQVAEAKAYAAEHKVDFVAAMKQLGFAS